MKAPIIGNLDMAQAEALARVGSIAASWAAYCGFDDLVVLPNDCPPIPGEEGTGHEDDPRAIAAIDVLRFLVAEYETEVEE